MITTATAKKTDSHNRILPPKAWQNNSHYLERLLNDPWYKHVASISSAVFVATHDFFELGGIKPFIFPITTGSVSSPMGQGSDSLPVKIKLREHEVFLADSMQFSLEVGTRLNKKGAYYIMPTFRGEAVDQRHLNEFVHSEVEIEGNLTDVMELAQSYVTFVVQEVAQVCEEDIASTAGHLDHIQQCLAKKGRFDALRHEDAVKDLGSFAGALEDIGTGHASITSKGERELLRRHGDFIWLTNMPWMNVPFYQAKEKETPYSMTADMLAGIGEILGCGQRVCNVAELDESLMAHGVGLNGYEWYSEMRKIHPLQTAGFGLGIERLILWLTQNDDIRDCSLLYRDHDQIFFP